MLAIRFEKSFLNGYKVLTKKHYNTAKVDKIIKILQNQEAIPGKYKNHSLKGNLQGLQELHIENDLLLIYRVIDNQILLLIRIGTHNDLLK